MGLQSARDFIEKMDVDEAFRTRILKRTGDERFRRLSEEGFDFSLDDYRRAREELMRAALTEDEQKAGANPDAIDELYRDEWLNLDWHTPGGRS